MPLATPALPPALQSLRQLLVRNSDYESDGEGDEGTYRTREITYLFRTPSVNTNTRLMTHGIFHRWLFSVWLYFIIGCHSCYQLLINIFHIWLLAAIRVLCMCIVYYLLLRLVDYGLMAGLLDSNGTCARFSLFFC